MSIPIQHPPEEQIIAGPAGVHLAIEEHGDASSPLTVVLIHGGYQSRRCFKYQYPFLSVDHHVLGIDLPGNGRSTLPTNGSKLSPRFYAESIYAVLSAFHLEEKPLILLGWSFGGAVCRYFLDLFERQMKIVGLIQLASIMGGFETYLSYIASDSSFRPILKAFGGMDESTTTKQENFVNFFFNRLMSSASHIDEDTLDAIYGYNQRAWWNLLPLGNTFLEELPQNDSMQWLEHLTLPTLLLHGKEDELVPLSFSREMNTWLPQSQLIEIDQCGHSVMLEQPVVVNQLIGNFLAKLVQG